MYLMYMRKIPTSHRVQMKKTLEETVLFLYFFFRRQNKTKSQRFEKRTENKNNIEEVGEATKAHSLATHKARFAAYALSLL